MCFVTKLDLLIVVEGTATLKIYAAGPHKIGEIEPGIAMQRISIDNNRRSTRHAGLKRGNQGGRSANVDSKSTADRSHEVCFRCNFLIGGQLRHYDRLLCVDQNNVCP